MSCASLSRRCTERAAIVPNRYVHRSGRRNRRTPRARALRRRRAPHPARAADHAATSSSATAWPSTAAASPSPRTRAKRWLSICSTRRWRGRISARWRPARRSISNAPSPHTPGSAAISCRATSTPPAPILAFEQVKADHRLEIALPKEFARYVAFKGSIAIDGISLTVAEVRDEKLCRLDHPAHPRRHEPAGRKSRRPGESGIRSPGEIRRAPPRRALIEKRCNSRGRHIRAEIDSSRCGRRSRKIRSEGPVPPMARAAGATRGAGRPPRRARPTGTARGWSPGGSRGRRTRRSDR